MLEIIIAVFPGILAALIYYRTNKKLQWGKLFSYILFYTLFTNLCILSGLHLIGMERFNLFDMSTRFKVKWILLEFVLTLFFTIVIAYIRKLNPSACKNIIIRLFPATLFFIVTYAIYTPSSLFLANIEEFSIYYSQIVPIILCISLILLLGIYLLAIFLLRENIIHIYIALLFSISLCLYIQGNFLNPDFPVLDGTDIDWQLYKTQNIISICFWILCVIACLTLVHLKKEKTEKIMKYISYFLSAVQLVSLVVLICFTKYDKNLQAGFTQDDMFTIGSEENIIIFLIDTLQADTMEEFITSDEYADGSLDDFTFFDNTVSGAAPTHIALQLLLTGVELDPTQSYDSYSKEAWEETELYNDLHNNGYNICLFTDSNVIFPPDGVIDNYETTGEYEINNYPVFSQRIYKLVNFYLMPQCFKQYFWLTESAMNGLKAEGRYNIDDYQFYTDLLAVDEFEVKYENAFRFYHLNGIHKPWHINENVEYVKQGGTEQQVVKGDIKIIYEYIDQLKKADVYEKSTIIILGDHGRHEDGNIESNPAVLLKLPYETHKLAYNSNPIHFRNIVASMAETFLNDYSHYGPSVYDISEDSDVERLHTITDSIRDRANLDNVYNATAEFTRLIIKGKADNGNYEVWNPYEINRISYQIGDIIDFTNNNHYAEYINYRLYKENGAATASNELSICFELETAHQSDLEFHFIYSGIYNDSQKIRLYANGNKIEDIICTQKGIEKENVSIIPKDYIDDGKLILRMVFPNAVTPNQLDRNNTDFRILSVDFTSMWLEQ